MEISDLQSAKQWLYSWGPKGPTRGTLAAVIDGMTGCIALSEEGSGAWWGYVDARTELKTAYFKRTGEAYLT